ncbi:MAG: RNA polymerase-associated protein [Cellvibrionaceae bacterium]|jgi:RNA polymerase-associated protein
MGVVTRRSSMTYFSDSCDHYSHRVRIVLAEKSVSVELVEVEPGNMPAEVSELTPYNSLPALLDRDLVLYESKVMMEYLDERFPHPPLLPAYPVARAHSRLWMYRIERDWSPLVNTIAAKKDGKSIAKATADLRDSLISIAPIFSEKPFFMSDEFTLVDCCLAPILWRLDEFSIEIPATRQSQPLLDYMKRLFSRDSFQQSLSQQEQEMRS